ncbi:zinc ribbon domain-containing protein [Variovorax sp. J22P168]|uniref:zinc ribbon domain-containing protein n=1 Tax=Variovorax jilinensis TaxID=3053513 RepID=UPI00257773A3|nr:zinc ribbon domain-containing protein [Variovorax sp. J22P168]MDM0014222.1 zinc ribbon domain-containing protein [Variovorax sp. J22P168]
MTQACADCRTENRDGAKFCKGCGRRLQALRPTPPGPPAGEEEEWPATQQMSRAAELPAPPSIPKPKAPSQAERQAEEEALAAVPAFRSEREFTRPIQRHQPQRAPRRRHADRHPLRRAVVGLLAVAALASAAFWYFSGPAPSPAPVLASVSPPPPTPPAASAPESAAAVVATLPPSSGTAGTAAMLDPTPSPAVVEPPAEVLKAEAAPTPPAKPSPARTRKPAPPPPPAPVVVPPPPAPEPPAPAPAPPPPPTPQAQCAGMNFIARAQCMATQCARPEMRAHAQCEAVRRQQQIEEEKRNPTLLN